MSKDNNPTYEIIEKGDLVMLRTLVETDRDDYMRWQTQGEWRLLDAPWAQNTNEEKKDKESEKQQTNTQDNTAPKKQAGLKDDSVPKKRAVIATLNNKPLGWVNQMKLLSGTDLYLLMRYLIYIDQVKEDIIGKEMLLMEY